MSDNSSFAIEEQRKVEGFGDPLYECNAIELAIRRRIYMYFQGLYATGAFKEYRLTQDWEGNVLHLNGTIRPKDLAAHIMADIKKIVRE